MFEASTSGPLSAVTRNGPYHGHNNMRCLPDSSAGELYSKSPIFTCNALLSIIILSLVAHGIVLAALQL